MMGLEDKLFLSEWWIFRGYVKLRGCITIYFRFLSFVWQKLPHGAFRKNGAIFATQCFLWLQVFIALDFSHTQSNSFKFNDLSSYLVGSGLRRVEQRAMLILATKAVSREVHGQCGSKRDSKENDKNWNLCRWARTRRIHWRNYALCLKARWMVRHSSCWSIMDCKYDGCSCMCFWVVFCDEHNEQE